MTRDQQLLLQQLMAQVYDTRYRYRLTADQIVAIDVPDVPEVVEVVDVARNMIGFQQVQFRIVPVE